MPRQRGKRYPSDENWNAKRRQRAAPPSQPAAPATPPKKRGRPRKDAAPAPPHAPTTPRKRRGTHAGAAPALASFVDQPAGLGELDGGVCPNPACGRAHGDEDRNCAWCGSPLRHACPKCQRPAQPGTRYCGVCAVALPTMPTEGIAGAPAATDASSTTSANAPPAPPTNPAPVTKWEPSDVQAFAMAVDFACIKMGLKPLDDDERQNIHTSTAVMANKYFGGPAKWRDEIKWVASWGMPIVAGLYIKYVVAPERERDRAEAAAARATAAAPAPAHMPTPAPPPSASEGPRLAAVNLEAV